MKIYIYGLLMIILIAMIACDNSANELCISNQQAVQVGFYSANTPSHADTIIQPATIYGIEGMVPNDSLLAKEQAVNKVFLPLNMFHDTTQYVIQTGNFRDTISFVHQKELSFVSEECGFIFEFTIDTVLYTRFSFIDSVTVSYPSVIYNENKENVKVYIY